MLQLAIDALWLTFPALNSVSCKAICDCRIPKKILASEEIDNLSDHEDADLGFA